MENQVLETYNDYVKYYLYNEFDARIPQVVDKLGLKEYAATKGVATPRTLTVGRTVEEAVQKFVALPPNFVMKANNDSGGTLIVKNGKTNKDPQRLMKHRMEPYGLAKGEWFYGPIIHKIFTEEFLEDNITDYKFHCHNGKVMFCQYIYDRSTGDTKECIILPNGHYLNYRLDENFKHDNNTPLPDNWEELLETAKILAEDWKYVRVDLFSVKGKVYVGELTFAPRAGNYTGHGQALLGQFF